MFKIWWRCCMYKKRHLKKTAFLKILYLEKWSLTKSSSFWNLLLYQIKLCLAVASCGRESSISQLWIRRWAFQILLAKFFPCWQSASSKSKSFPVHQTTMETIYYTCKNQYNTFNSQAITPHIFETSHAKTNLMD